ncbi:MAG TPA: OsmC family protein [Longimicrobiales bacterium]|nr:OsmC family protein [Longimicrobiales bacterium]
MADPNVRLEWTGQGLQFSGVSPDGPRIPIDGDGASGPSPVQMLALALGGCMAVDVLDITRKSRVSITGLSVDIEYHRREDPPRRITAVRHVFRTTGVTPADEARVRRAIDLSREKYCSVLHSLREDIEMSFELELG